MAEDKGTPPEENILNECENLEIASGPIDVAASADGVDAGALHSKALVTFGQDLLAAINDMVVLPDQCFLISEACFKKIWKFSTNGEMIQNITLNTEPYGLCILQDQRVAVSLPYRAKITIFTYSDLNEQISISFAKKYYGLASDNGERIFALYRERSMFVDIISKDNPRSSYEISHVITLPKSFYFCDDYRLRTLPSGYILAITPTIVMTVTCLNQNGEMIFTYSGGPNNCLSLVGDIAVSRDFIFIADKNDHKIHRIRHQGDFVDIPLTSKDGIVHPRNIFINDEGVLAVLSKNKKITQVQLFSS